jgi:hypothetical protein
VRRGIVAWLLVVALLAMLGVPSLRDAHAQADVSLARGWQHVLLTTPDLSPDAFLQVVPGGPGLVAYSATPRPLLWTSADAHTWQRTGVPLFQSDDFPGRFFAAGPLFILMGGSRATVPNVPRIWASQDAGKSWQQSPAELGISALTAGGDGVIAFSRSPSLPSSMDVWTSADGLRWRQLPDPNGVFASAEVLSVTRGGPGYVAGGDAGQLPAMWTSADGLTWTKISNDAAVFGTPDESGYIDQVVAGPHGLLALGEENNGEGGTQQGLTWTSPDGMHWQQGGTDLFPEGHLVPGRVAAWRDGFVGLSDLSAEAILYASPDGLTWSRIGSDELFGGTARITTVVGFRDGVAAVGSFALHPKPACQPVSTFGDVQRFTPATFLWTPEQSTASPPPQIDWSDPRTLNLQPEDLPPSFPPAFFHPDWSGIYVNLCGQLPALGRHRAYLLYFAADIGGEALTVVAASSSAAKAAFRHVARLIFGDRKVELREHVRIGDETRAFRLRQPSQQCANDQGCRTFAVVWRHGRVIGGVLSTRFLAPCTNAPLHPPWSIPECKVAGLTLDIQLAQKQLAHLQHPSG